MEKKTRRKKNQPKLEEKRNSLFQRRFRGRGGPQFPDEEVEMTMMLTPLRVVAGLTERGAEHTC